MIKRAASWFLKFKKDSSAKKKADKKVGVKKTPPKPLAPVKKPEMAREKVSKAEKTAVAPLNPTRRLTAEGWRRRQKKS